MHVRLLGPCFKTGRWKPLLSPTRENKAIIVSRPLAKTQRGTQAARHERKHHTSKADDAVSHTKKTVRTRSRVGGKKKMPRHRLDFFPQCTRIGMSPARDPITRAVARYLCPTWPSACESHTHDDRGLPMSASTRVALTDAARQLITAAHTCSWFQTFPFRQFHALFNSLFKVLFIFPSRYLFAIGLPPLFSFRRVLPPA